MSALKRGPLWPTITSVAMTTSVTMPPGPLPIVLSALPGWNRHTFPDNVAYYGHSGIIFFFFFLRGKKTFFCYSTTTNGPQSLAGKWGPWVTARCQ